MVDIKGFFFTKDYKVGDKVIHAMTGALGRVVATEKHHGRQYINMRTREGVLLRGLDRREFQSETRL